MAEEQKNPEEEQSKLEQDVEEAKNSVDDDLPEFVDGAEEVAETVAQSIAEKMDEAQEAIESSVSDVADAVSSDDNESEPLETIEAQAEDVVAEVEATSEDLVEAIQEDDLATTDDTAIEKAEQVVASQSHHDHHYSDEVVIPYFGYVGTMPGGIYTFIFLVLGGLTVLEVLITFIGENAFTITLLVIFSLMKAVLVIMYYMHLKDDNVLYRWVIILPLLIVLASTLYLLGVPAGAGLGYS